MSQDLEEADPTWPPSYLQPQQLLAGLDVPLDLAGHRLDHLDAVFVEHVEHVPDAQTCRNQEVIRATHTLASQQGVNVAIPLVTGVNIIYWERWEYWDPSGEVNSPT